jgi:Fe-S-cluster containining protein
MPQEPTTTPFTPLSGNIFQFRCHKDVPCFTKCCAQLNLMLTPYDILRMKNRQGLSSMDFLEEYTEPKQSERSRFPTVYLRMREDEHRTCPFVGPPGCSIYEDRPSACRIYPVGRAASKRDGEKKAKEKYFLVHEDHCLGFKEDQSWHIDEWLSNEGVDAYIAMNDPWMEIVTSRKSLGPQKEVPRKLQMFSMASYNLDAFRKFLFKSRFLDLFHVDLDRQEGLAQDDVALMLFAFDWLKFSLFGEKTIHLKT